MFVFLPLVTHSALFYLLPFLSMFLIGGYEGSAKGGCCNGNENFYKIFPSLLSGQLPAKAFRGETVRRYVSLSWSSAAVFVEQEEGVGVGSGSAQGRAKATQGYPSPQIARHP